MSKLLIILLFSVTLPFFPVAQTYPKEGGKLNYRIIGFSFPAIPHVNKYTIEIAAGSYDNENLFKKNVIKSQVVNSNKSILEVPSFNAQYTWRVIYKKTRTKIPVKNELHHFSTGIVRSVDTSIDRLRITTAAKQYKDAFVFVDVNGVMYDMDGNPVWYLPHLQGTNENVQLRDLKLSPFGTITLLDGPEIYEINYNGEILWTKTSNKTNNNKQNTSNGDYHHEFTRLLNGHYMALGSQDVLYRFPHTANENLSIFPDNNPQINKDTSFKKGTCGNLIEYDEKGNVIWTWNAYKYIMRSDLVYLFKKIGKNFDLHDNAFFFDEANKHIYISFRNINRVIEIKYPEGNVVNTYGKIFDINTSVGGGARMPAIVDDDNGVFCLQHACKRSQKGYLYLFDNDCDPDGHSKVLMIDQPTPQDKMKVVWQYDCDAPTRHLPTQLRSGGNVIELPDRSLFVSMDMQGADLFIVSSDKKILWSSVSESFDKTRHVWHANPSYRASMITTRKDLEQLIWNSEKE